MESREMDDQQAGGNKMGNCQNIVLRERYVPFLGAVRQQRFFVSILRSLHSTAPPSVLSDISPTGGEIANRLIAAHFIKPIPRPAGLC
ncbi:MAG: hypothetical protein ACRCU5_07895 [Rhizobiaceae bacterium]